MFSRIGEGSKMYYDRNTNKGMREEGLVWEQTNVLSKSIEDRIFCTV